MVTQQFAKLWSGNWLESSNLSTSAYGCVAPIWSERWIPNPKVEGSNPSALAICAPTPVEEGSGLSPVQARFESEGAHQATVAQRKRRRFQEPKVGGSNPLSRNICASIPTGRGAGLRGLWFWVRLPARAQDGSDFTRQQPTIQFDGNVKCADVLRSVHGLVAEGFSAGLKSRRHWVDSSRDHHARVAKLVKAPGSGPGVTLQRQGGFESRPAHHGSVSPSGSKAPDCKSGGLVPSEVRILPGPLSWKWRD